MFWRLGCSSCGTEEAEWLPVLLEGPESWPRQGHGFGQLHGASVPAGKSLFGEENVRDLPKGSSEGKGRAEGCDVPWGGGEELPGWTRALLGWRRPGLGLRWGMVPDRMLHTLSFTLLWTDPPSKGHKVHGGVQRLSPACSICWTCQRLFLLSETL